MLAGFWHIKYVIDGSARSIRTMLIRHPGSLLELQFTYSNVVTFRHLKISIMFPYTWICEYTVVRKICIECWRLPLFILYLNWLVVHETKNVPPLWFEIAHRVASICPVILGYSIDHKALLLNYFRSDLGKIKNSICTLNKFPPKMVSIILGSSYHAAVCKG